MSVRAKYVSLTRDVILAELEPPNPRALPLQAETGRRPTECEDSDSHLRQAPILQTSGFWRVNVAFLLLAIVQTAESIFNTMPATFVDLSHALDSATQVYPGDPAFSCCPTMTIPKDGMNLQTITMGSHTGTHVDAPYHFFDTGLTIDQIPLSTFVGNAVVVDVTAKLSKALITWTDISAHEESIRRKASLDDGVFVLLRTGWSKYWSSDEYYHHPFLEVDAARRLLELGVKLIGIDTLSPDETRLDGSMPEFGVHEVVLGAGAMLAENLTNLEAIQTDDWLVTLMPLKLGGCDGSPVRAFACKRET